MYIYICIYICIYIYIIIGCIRSSQPVELIKTLCHPFILFGEERDSDNRWWSSFNAAPYIQGSMAPSNNTNNGSENYLWVFLIIALPVSSMYPECLSGSIIYFHGPSMELVYITVSALYSHIHSTYLIYKVLPPGCSCSAQTIAKLVYT